MRGDKKQAFSLRNLRKSYSAIVLELGVPKSTLSDWFKNDKWSIELARELNAKHIESNTIRLRELNNIRGVNLKSLYEQAEKEAVEEFQMLKNHPLFIAGVMLYWGEGDKASSHGFNISNTDPRMIGLFLDFLRLLCGVSERGRIYANLFIYPDLDEKICKEYWVKNARLENVHFIKTTVLPSRHKTKKLMHGIIKVGIGSTYLKKKMMIWINSFPIYLRESMK